MTKIDNKKLLELLRQMDDVRDQIVAEVSRVTGQLRPCGCGKRGRHLPTCSRSANGSGWDGRKLACCGSHHRTRHKRGCELNAGDGRLPAGFWKCVGCGTSKEQRPVRCAVCRGSTFIQE